MTSSKVRGRRMGCGGGCRWIRSMSLLSRLRGCSRSSGLSGCTRRADWRPHPRSKKTPRALSWGARNQALRSEGTRIADMLGLTVACELDERRPFSAGSSVRTTLPDGSCLLVDDEGLLVSTTTRGEYPLAVFETPSGTLILEGRIYSSRPESLSAFLTTLAEEIA